MFFTTVGLIKSRLPVLHCANSVTFILYWEIQSDVFEHCESKSVLSRKKSISLFGV